LATSCALKPAIPLKTLTAKQVLIVVTLTVFALVLIRTAWVSDDAYITFRTIDNFFHGYGLRWNIAERVQTYTHPLWMLVVGAAYGVTREPYYTSLAISFFLTLAAMYVLVNRLSCDIGSAIVAALVLVLSHAFVDYSTSGLESPLTHFILVVFFVLYFGKAPELRRLFGLTVLTALLAINHADTVLLVLPALAATAWQQRNTRGSLRMLILGSLPFVAWEFFSLVYYGFPLPNTAYAKLLRIGVPAPELMRQGLVYFLDSLRWDPITLSTIAGVSTFAIVAKMPGTSPLILGTALYLLYVVRIGGDFMSGRLFAAPLLCSALLIARVQSARISRKIGALALVVLVVGLSSHLMIDDARSSEPGDGRYIARTGIANERLFWFPETGLVNILRGRPLARGRIKNAAAEGLSAPGPAIQIEELAAVGLHGYYAGPSVHIIDQLGLCDPLLARLPSAENWRIGHFYRGRPAGYRETVATGVNHLRDPGLIAYYNRLATITRGPIFTRSRFQTIIRMNLGDYDSSLTRRSSESPAGQ
jgi:arabinofuranosyltransferase